MSDPTPPTNIVWSADSRTREEREARLGQKGCVLWFTGLSGSGKSTVARALEHALVDRGLLAYLLDGDNLRHGLNSDLSFSPAARHENIRRISEVARLFADAGAIIITAAISPYQADRQRARDLVGADRFVLVHVATSLAECERRDVKGLYAKARSGDLGDFTGISAPYEEPADPDVHLETENMPVMACVAQVLAHLDARQLAPYRLETQA